MAMAAQLTLIEHETHAQKQTLCVERICQESETGRRRFVASSKQMVLCQCCHAVEIQGVFMSHLRAAETSPYHIRRRVSGTQQWQDAHSFAWAKRMRIQHHSHGKTIGNAAKASEAYPPRLARCITDAFLDEL